MHALTLIIGAVTLSLGIALLFAGFFSLIYGYEEDEYAEWKKRVDEQKKKPWGQRTLIFRPGAGDPDRASRRWGDRSDLRNLCFAGVILIVIGAAAFSLGYII